MRTHTNKRDFCIGLLLGVGAIICVAAGTVPILNGVLQSTLNCGGYAVSNVFDVVTADGVSIVSALASHDSITNNLGTASVEDIDAWSGSLIPGADDAYDLGSPSFHWRHLYVGTNSLKFSSGLRLGTDGAGSNLVWTAGDGTARTGATDAALQSEITTRAAADSDHDTDIAALQAVDDIHDSRDLSMQLQLAVLSDFAVPMLSAYADWYADTNSVAVQDYATYDSAGDYFESDGLTPGGSATLSAELHLYCDDNAASSTVTDSSGNGYSCHVLSNYNDHVEVDTDLISTNGQINYAFYCGNTTFNNYSGPFVNCPDFDMDSIVANGTFSICVWIKINDAETDNAGYFLGVDGGPPPSTRLYLVCQKDGHLNWSFAAESSRYDYDVIDSLADGPSDWLHTVIVFSNANQTAYYNGGSVDTATDNHTYANWNDGTNGFIVGGHYASNASRLYGTRDRRVAIDDFRIYDFALTPDQVSAIYNEGSGTQTDEIGEESPASCGSAVVQGDTVGCPDEISEGRIQIAIGPTVADTTNAMAWITNDGSTYDAVNLTYRGLWAGQTNIWQYEGWTNFSATGATKTNLGYRVIITNDASGVRLHGVAISGR
jgi:hypothetical protein